MSATFCRKCGGVLWGTTALSTAHPCTCIRTPAPYCPSCGSTQPSHDCPAARQRVLREAQIITEVWCADCNRPYQEGHLCPTVSLSNNVVVKMGLKQEREIACLQRILNAPNIAPAMRERAEQELERIQRGSEARASLRADQPGMEEQARRTLARPIGKDVSGQEAHALARMVLALVEGL